MSSEHLLSIVQSKLIGGEILISATEATLIEEWEKSPRIVALVKKDTTYALFSFKLTRNPPRNYSHLLEERALPINHEFKCDFKTNEEEDPNSPSNIVLELTSKKLQMILELRPTDETSKLVAEIFAALDAYSKNKPPESDFFWMKKMMDGQRQFDPSAGDSLDMPNSVESCPDITIRRNLTPRMGSATRESVVRHQMSTKEQLYTYTENFRIFTGTWNVNGQPTNGITLEQWLSSDEIPPDLYAIGFQELDLSKEAFLFNDTPREEEWRQVVAKSLHPEGIYFQVAIVRLVGMLLIVYAKESHREFIDNVCIDTVGTGIMGKMGNKGGVAVSLSLHNTSICFVNAHLAAHCEEYERRNQDYADICTRLMFSRNTQPKGFKNHDQIYWLGDLNYRITEMDVLTAKKHLNAGNYDAVLVLDQLMQQRKLKRVFQDFEEAKITFKPTYKYDPGTDNWDSSEKNRAPAWCDRVLWKGRGITSIDYRSHPELKISDHKPVSAVFESKIRIIDKLRYRKIHEEVMKELDKQENEFLPQVMVDTTEIIFDTLRFNEPVSKELTIANTGQVVVQFEFIKKLDDTSYCKEWLRIYPYTGIIEPGEKCDITLEIAVDKKSACKLNSGEDKLYDILVLHLEGGKDIFITITGTYERSCFGCSMEALVHMKVPIRELHVGRIMELENNKNLSPDPYTIPKEVWHLVDKLYRHGIKTVGLFEMPGSPHEIIAIRDWLDCGSQDPMPGHVYSVAESLLILLESTAEPLIPYNLHNVCLSTACNYLQCKQIVMELPEVRKTVFLYICSFLNELLKHQKDNKLDVTTLATIFGSIFLRDPPGIRDDKSLKNRSMQNSFDRNKAAFVHHFLVNDQTNIVSSFPSD